MNLPELLESREVREQIAGALIEDIGPADITTETLVDEEQTASARLLSRGEYVLAGGPVAQLVFGLVDSRARVEIHIQDGQRIHPGDAIMTVTGRARGLLTAERTALNFIQRMTGTATLTRQFVEKVARHKVAILDTRKTTPMMRTLQKYAVRCGGGQNHRLGLYDRILIKDNHLAFWREYGTGDIADAVRLAHKKFPKLIVEIEVENEQDLRRVLPAKPDWVMLDNMPVEHIRRCVEICKGRTKLEASGGVTLETVAAIAATGVDAISIGSLTHSAPSADLTLEFA